MPSVINNNSKEHITTATEKKSSNQNHTSVKTAVNDHNGNTVNLPEDIVNLSASQAAAKNPSGSKNSSTAVTSEEKTALFDPFSGRMSFSIFS